MNPTSHLLLNILRGSFGNSMGGKQRDQGFDIVFGFLGGFFFCLFFFFFCYFLGRSHAIWRFPG